jgi:histidinol-phosphate aminotransferase
MTDKWPDWLPLRESLRSRTPYGAPQVAADARLNTNENPYPLPENVARAIEESIKAVLTGLNRYPDRDAMELRKALVGYVKEHVFANATLDGPKLDEGNIWPANGSNEVLQSILLAFGENVAGFAPSYSMHSILTEAVGKSFKAVPLKGDFTPDLEVLKGFLTAKRPSVFFLTTPNNPTGRSIAIEQIGLIAGLVASHGGLLVVDEAYGEFSDQQSAITLIDEYPALIVVRTMSKAFAFAGARLGYAVARREVIDALQLVRLPYHLSAITQAAALAAIGESRLLLSEVAQIKRDRDALAQSLSELGFDVTPSDANFILFGGFDSFETIKGWTSERLWRALLERGILIRDVGIPGTLRVTVGTSAENDSFINALRAIATA